MNLVEFLGKIAFGFLALLPLILTFCNYFTVLKTPEQRISWQGILFLIISVIYGLLCLYFLCKN